MKQYLDLLRHTMSSGNDKGNRTGVWARSVFGYQMRFDLSAGFPMVTTKKLFLKGIVHELLMFIKGETNNEYLLAQDVHIWDGWALKEDVCEPRRLTNYQRAMLLAEKQGILPMSAVNMLNARGEMAEKYLEEEGIPTHRDVLKFKKGELGPVYGQQWRSWKGANSETIDQLKDVIQLLRTNPDSRRMIVTAWNPADLPDESISPQENVKNGKMALAACHCLFQFYTTPLSVEERYKLWSDSIADEYKQKEQWLTDNAYWENYQESVQNGIDTEGHRDTLYDDLDRYGVPQRSLSCQLYQRSADEFLGVPFNIASYALLTHMVAQVCNMTAGEFIWTGGDCHVYSNCFDQVNEQIQREPMPLAKLVLNPLIREIDDFTFADIRVDGYTSHPAIKAQVAV